MHRFVSVVVIELYLFSGRYLLLSENLAVLSNRTTLARSIAVDSIGCWSLCFPPTKPIDWLELFSALHLEDFTLALAHF